MSPAVRGALGELPAAGSVLVVCAHPDDESFGLGAVLDRFAAGGAQVVVASLTHGEASTLGPAPGSLRTVRAAELAAAAAALGVHGVALFDYPDGGLDGVEVAILARTVRELVAVHRPDLILVFDADGVTGHPDHRRATEAALAGSGELPVLAWTVHEVVAEALNAELGTRFVGCPPRAADYSVTVRRARQRGAIACHASQSDENPVLWRRLALQGDRELLRWLRPGSPGDGAGVGARRAPASG